MMKFRVWDKSDKCWATDFTMSLDGQLLCDNGTTLFLRDNFVVMQWTGLRDNTGKMIFEGDIVVFYEPWGCHSHLIERHETNHNLVARELYLRANDPDEYEELDELNFASGIIEGNCWEEPELLIGYENDEPAT